MASSLEASAIIGNLYTASMYMGLRSMLEFEFKKGTDLEQKRIGFGSYGAAVALWSLAERVITIQEVVSKMDLDSEIGPRQKLTMEDRDSTGTKRKQ